MSDSPTPGSESATDALARALVRMGLAGRPEDAVFTPLAGGVSSDIYRVDVGAKVICVKRALPQLKVSAEWRAPVGRNRNEHDYLQAISRIVPGSVPSLLGVDEEAGCFAMQYFDPARFPTWKAELAAGRIDVETAMRVGSLLGRVHAGTANDARIAGHFATDESFDALRLDPYLATTARAHPDLAGALHALIDATRGNKRVLVHGDYSPKNLLVGPNAPVILDAECAWHGDPAFDLAFVLNHLLLKGAWHPHWKLRYLACFGALARAYFDLVDWEDRGSVEARVAALLPGLMLARVDGKSPVEYLVDARVRDSVRRFAIRFVVDPAERLFEITTAWQNYEEIR